MMLLALGAPAPIQAGAQHRDRGAPIDGAGLGGRERITAEHRCEHVEAGLAAPPFAHELEGHPVAERAVEGLLDGDEEERAKE